ncbi:S24 family peptidase [Pseudomonas aeruginosa]
MAAIYRKRGGKWLLADYSWRLNVLPTRQLPPGTPILVQPEGFDLISGKYYVAKHSDGETTFKQYVYDAGVKYLVPLNKAYRTLEMDDDWEIIGRVIDAKVPGL